MLELLNKIPKWFEGVISLIKGAVTAWYIRRSARIETEKSALEDANVIKTKQNEIAASPPADPDDLRRRMREGRF